MSRRGFTIVEAMLALLLTGMLAAMVSSFLWTVSRSKNAAEVDGAEQRALGMFMDRLEDDLTACIAGDETLGAGIAGGATKLAVLSRGVGVPTDPGLGEQAARDQLSDLRGTEFALQGSVIVGRRWVGPTAGGAGEPIATGIAGVRFRYFDGKQWATAFDSKSRNALPVAIEVAVWMTAGGPMQTATGAAGAVDAGQPIAAPVSGDAAGGEVAAPSEGAAAPAGTLRAPDRWRLITIPDGPTAGWKEGA